MGYGFGPTTPDEVEAWLDQMAGAGMPGVKTFGGPPVGSAPAAPQADAWHLDRIGARAAWDRGFDAEGRQVWGAVAGPYVFERVRR